MSRGFDVPRGEPPRAARARARPLWAGRALAVATFAGLPALIQCAIGVGNARIAALESRGLFTEGWVTNVEPVRGDYGGSVHYQYAVDGVTYQWSDGFRAERDAGKRVPQIGKPLPVIYLPDNPSKNVPVSIERARQKADASGRLLRRGQIFLFVVFGSIFIVAEVRTHRLVTFARRARTAQGTVLAITSRWPLKAVVRVRYRFELPAGKVFESTYRLHANCNARLISEVGMSEVVSVAYDPALPSRSYLWATLARAVELPNASLNA